MLLCNEFVVFNYVLWYYKEIGTTVNVVFCIYSNIKVASHLEQLNQLALACFPWG